VIETMRRIPGIDPGDGFFAAVIVAQPQPTQPLSTSHYRNSPIGTVLSRLGLCAVPEQAASGNTGMC